MKARNHKIITIILSLIVITLCAGVLANSTNTYAESSSANASVTVANTITLTLTGGDLVINNLTPGNSADSNVITASVTSNSPYGFHLAATTGTSTGTDSLVNTADSNFTFTNLSTNKATLANFSDNTWGYSYSTDSGTNWVSGDYGQATAGYNGLPLDNNDSGATSTTLYNSNSYQGSQSVQFKIGAKSASTQAAGTYTNTINFYAVTNPEPPETMQDFAAGTASTTCANMSVGDTLTLRDSRDQTEYLIGKLADNKCWMLDNLALDLTNSTVLNAMTADNTNASATTLGYLKNGGGTTSDQYATAAVTNWTSSYSYSAPLVNLTNKDIVPTDATSTAGGYKVGGYYNYCAASAGSYCYGNGTSAGTSSGNATEDICPKGWRMPAGNTTGEYQALYDNASYNTYANYRSALHLPLSGYFDDGSAYTQGSDGRWWSSTRNSNSGMYRLYVSTSNIYPADYNNRYHGNSLRCILDS